MLFINDKYEKLSIQNVNFIFNILVTYLAHKVSTLCPSFINGTCKKSLNRQVIFQFGNLFSSQFIDHMPHYLLMVKKDANPKSQFTLKDIFSS
jgi:hypothetical protein